MNTRENLREGPKKQTQSSPFWLMVLGLPVGFVAAVLAVRLVNWALPPADANAFKEILFSSFGGSGTGASLLGAYGFVRRSNAMTEAKIACQVGMGAVGIGVNGEGGAVAGAGGAEGSLKTESGLGLGESQLGVTSPAPLEPFGGSL